MRILDFLAPSCIALDVRSGSKPDVLAEMCDVLRTGGAIQDADALLKGLVERERLGSTGIGQGVAIPHCKTAAVRGVIAALGISRRGVAFESLDGEPVHILFLLVSAPDAGVEHLKALARVSRLLKDKFFRQALREAKSSDEIRQIINQQDDY